LISTIINFFLAERRDGDNIVDVELEPNDPGKIPKK